MAAGSSAARRLVAAAFVFPALLLSQDKTQSTALERAMDLEGKSQFRQAAAEYRNALTVPDAYAVSLLGFERCLHEIGMVDSVLVVVDSIVRAKPAEQIARTVQLRSLRTLGQNQRMRQAFDSWRGAAKGEAAPYREYSRLLIEGGKMAMADSVLREAEIALSNVRTLSIELAQVRAALGMWDAAAEAWRDAVEDADYLERAALFGLNPAPAPVRDTIRAIFLAAPVNINARKTLASIEFGWGMPQQAWKAVSELAPGDSARTVWLEFADKAETMGAWLPARDALMAAFAVKPELAIASRAAVAAESGADYEGAVALIQKSVRGQTATDAAKMFGVTHVRALAALGRADEADAAAVQYVRNAPDLTSHIQHEVALGWVRAGNIDRAKRALAQGASDTERGEIGGWLALYSGNLREARAQIRGYGDASRFPGTVTAMAILGRTRADSSASLGAAFLALARGDSARSSAAFDAATKEVPDAASLVLSVAARLIAARDLTAATALWQRLLDQYPEFPEAAEADLEWARALRRKGDNAGSIARLEHLIITYPSSALVPQARRELESIRGKIPPETGVEV